MNIKFNNQDAIESNIFNQAKRYSQANHWRSNYQVTTTLLLLLAGLVSLNYIDNLLAKLILILPIAGLFVRIFVLQHDCGHNSLYKNRRINNWIGHLLSFITTVPFTLWAKEHNWHHGNQGKLEHRGIDMMNSPMTTEEASKDYNRRTFLQTKITPLNVFLIGAKSLLIDRKFIRDFFMFREAFKWPIANESYLRKSLYLAHLGSIIMHSVFMLIIGWENWLLVFLPAAFIAAGLGSLLFWLQHNFEDSYYESEANWQYKLVGLKGSSYLKLPKILNWFSASIGLHHVHHLNASIPNYRLEEARQGIEELAMVKPLSKQQISDSFKKIFWNTDTKKMSEYEL